uniref:Phosphatase and actin regulator n=1 Tax=Anabas testudineus TaxID=64144 RepID=A0A7N6C501_ANATE
STALKTPAAFHEQIRSLERARTGNFLKHKLCSRPDRSQLVRMHILQETQAEPSLQATQMKLKRARLADDLNEKIAQRPGPMDLVEKNILHSSPLSNNKKAESSDDCSASVLETSKACNKKGLSPSPKNPSGFMHVLSCTNCSQQLFDVLPLYFIQKFVRK